MRKTMTGRCLVRSFTSIFLLGLTLCITLYGVSVCASDEQPLPLKIFHPEKGAFIPVGSNIKLILPEKFSSNYKASIDEIRETFSKYPQTKHPVSIELEILKNLNNLPENVRIIFNKHQNSYWMKIYENKILINSNSEAGALNALTSLELLLDKYLSVIPVGEVIDWPSFDFRGLLLIPGPGVDVDRIKHAISTARKSRLNAIVLYINQRILFSTLRTKARSDKISLSELKDIVTYARESGLEVIPLVNLLTRQSHGGLMLRAMRLGIEHSMYNEDTYDPNESKNYQLVFSFLNEIIKEINPGKIHIGHSEVLGSYPKHRKNMEEKREEMLPANLFLNDVVKLHDFLKSKNIETWMWGDMLISQKEFPSASTFADEGFRVVGATAKNLSTTVNFTKYMSTNVGRNGLGMLAGIWEFWKQPPEESNRLISTAGDFYWNGE